MAAAVSVLAACGGDDATAPEASQPESTDTASPESPEEPPEDASPATGGSEADVKVENFVFSPATVEVAAGGTVTWTNADRATHTVTAGTPDEPQMAQFDFRLSSDSPTAEMSFDAAGVVAYFCSIHPTMLGTVTVV